MDQTAKKLVFFKLGTARSLNLSFPDEKRVSSLVTTSWSPQITASSYFAILYYFRLKKDSRSHCSWTLAIIIRKCRAELVLDQFIFYCEYEISVAMCERTFMVQLHRVQTKRKQYNF